MLLAPLILRAVFSLSQLANILVDLESCSIRICDFGLSRVLNTSGGGKGSTQAGGRDGDDDDDYKGGEADEDDGEEGEPDSAHTLYVHFFLAPVPFA